MSATCRGAERHDLDFYETPESAIRPLLPELGAPPRILDLGSGTGAIGRVLRESIEGGPFIQGLELDEKRAALSCWLSVDNRPLCSLVYDDVYVGDALGSAGPIIGSPHDLVISNPPYSLAMEFVQRGLELTRPGGITAMLLRLSWLSSQKRRDFHRDNPCDVFVLSERPSFTGNGKTDACDYAWFLWGIGRGGRWSVL